jgi:hypothetical protein
MSFRNIGFYGHSNCAYGSPESFLDIIALHCSAKIINTGVKQGSEERVLFELKKSKNLDLAIIFHCLPKFLFLPRCDRDINVHDIERKRAEQLFSDDHLDQEFNQENSPKFKKLFEDNKTFFNAVNTFKDYFYHPDLIMNRYYGALIQIDQYLNNKNISTIHILDRDHPLPSWFNFSKGVVNYTVMDIVKSHKATNPFFVNCISKEGNKLVATEIINIIDGGLSCISV